MSTLFAVKKAEQDVMIDWMNCCLIRFTGTASSRYHYPPCGDLLGWKFFFGDKG